MKINVNSIVQLKINKENHSHFAVSKFCKHIRVAYIIELYFNWILLGFENKTHSSNETHTSKHFIIIMK